MLRHSLLLVMLPLTLGCGANPTSQGKVTPQPLDNSPPLEMAAEGLWGEYGNNEVQADMRYAGKNIKIIGRVEVVQKDTAGKYFVGLSVLGTPVGAWPPNVICYVDPKATEGISKIKIDKQTTLIGRCVGRKPPVKSGTWQEYIVVLEACRLAE